MTKTEHSAPALAGIHHVKLPVSDLARSRAWYESRLGYVMEMEFVEEGVVMGMVFSHPNGGPSFALRLNPERASAAAGFDYFAIGVPSKEDVDALASRLTEMGDEHAGVQQTPFGWVLALLHDPDGHEVRFYVDTRLAS
jgi:catechol 2,3-dioxygenase-like lactoylglutathione lyase family enzyme